MIAIKVTMIATMKSVDVSGKYFWTKWTIRFFYEGVMRKENEAMIAVETCCLNWCLKNSVFVRRCLDTCLSMCFSKCCSMCCSCFRERGFTGMGEGRRKSIKN